MQLLLCGHHLEKFFHAIFARLRFLGRLKPPGDSVMVNFAQALKKCQGFGVFGELIEKILRNFHFAGRVVGGFPGGRRVWRREFAPSRRIACDLL